MERLTETHYYDPAYDSESSESKASSSVDLGMAVNTRGWYVYFGLMVVNVLLSLIFAVAFIILTAVGKENISTHDGAHSLDKRCDCAQFTPSVGYGLAASLFIEVGLIFLVFVLAVFNKIVTICRKYRIFFYYALFDGSFLALNGIAFLCMTLSVIIFVAQGSYCCSVTSVIVASLSAVILTLKIVFITVICCCSYCMSL